MKPITEELLPKPRKKARAPDVVPEGNVVAPTRKARAQRAKGPNARKPPRKFRSKTVTSTPDAMDWMLEDPPQPPLKKKSTRAKKGVSKSTGSPQSTPTEVAIFSIPDLNEVPTVEDPTPEVRKTVKKRQPRKKLMEDIPNFSGAQPMDSVTSTEVPPKIVKKRAPRKKKDVVESTVTEPGLDNVAVPGPPAAKKRAPRKKKGVPTTSIEQGSGQSVGQVINPIVPDSAMSTTTCKIGGSPAKATSECSAGCPKEGGTTNHSVADLTEDSNYGPQDNPLESLLSALCDTVIDPGCSSSVHEGACPCAEDVVGEVIDPGAAATDSIGVERKTKKNVAKAGPKLRRDSKKKWGASVKRGCLAQFTVKTFLHLPHISEICIIQEKHVNCDGLVVHGGMKIGDRSAFSAHLSPEIRLFVEECLRNKDTSNQIMKKHLDVLKRYQAEGREITRDLLLTTKDIRNISGKLAKETYMLDKNDAQSVRMWVQRNSDKVFYYTESNKEKPLPVPGELTGENMPFTIGIQTPWQKKMMLEHGHRSGISVDATFGTNEKKVRFLGTYGICFRDVIICTHCDTDYFYVIFFWCSFHCTRLWCSTSGIMEFRWRLS